ncbi:unnamed protein product [Orchesella dallaii]|uniref:Uncharacterized protein n=1 Tax=Orchesella dallaii TaxID=48710 RepID=A0ABP1Q988_9HEXA
MLIPMWTVRSDYHECMRPLDKAMDHYMDFRAKLLEIDQCIELGTATGSQVVAAFDQVLALYNVYDKNQLELHALLKKVNHQILYYSHATKNDLMWNEMIKLKEIDHTSFTRRTCSFEHVVVSLFKLDENIKDSIQTSKDITRCCANYLVRIAQHFSGQLSCNPEKETLFPQAIGVKSSPTK